MASTKIASQVPVIKFSEECTKPGTSSWAEACKVMAQALEDHGCFIVDHPSVPLGLHDSVFSVTKELFDLPAETKIKNTNFKRPLGIWDRAPDSSLVEAQPSMSPRSLRSAKSSPLSCGPPGMITSGSESLDKQDQLHHSSKAVHDYAKFIAELEKEVFRMVCESYGVEKCYDPYIDSSSYLVRFLKDKKPEGIEASANPTEHTDKSFLSYLHQNNITGLEVRTKDGDWFTFEPSASTFMVMGGEACVAWSNGRIKACDHRVEVSKESRVRCSHATFSYVTGMVEMPEEFIDEAHPGQYNPFNHIDLLSHDDSGDNRIRAESLAQSSCGVLAN